jgi:hypothetical protein
MNIALKPLVLTLTIAIAAPAVFTADSAQLAAARCYNDFVKGKTASAAKKSKAKQWARGKWSSKAVSTIGGRDGGWSLARQKHYECAYAARWYCKAIAVPCMFAVKSTGNGTQKPIH